MCRILTNSGQLDCIPALDVFYLCLPQCVAKDLHRWQFRLHAYRHVFILCDGEAPCLLRSESYHLTASYQAAWKEKWLGKFHESGDAKSCYIHTRN